VDPKLLRDVFHCWQFDMAADIHRLVDVHRFRGAPPGAGCSA
jgi:hypothetical protein